MIPLLKSTDLEFVVVAGNILLFTTAATILIALKEWNIITVEFAAWKMA